MLSFLCQRDVRLAHESLEEQIGRMFGQEAPSKCLTGLPQTLIFYLGAKIDIPIITMFSLYAGTAVLIVFLLQVLKWLFIIRSEGQVCDQYTHLPDALTLRTRNSIRGFVRPLVGRSVGPSW